jgi:methylmalonyl-CoA mutase
MRIVGDVFAFTAEHMPRFNSISISGYHMQEAGATADLELAYTLADGLEYIRTGLAAGLDVDAFAPRLSFFWGVGMNVLVETAKLRAGRMLWSELVAQFDPSDAKSQLLRAHCQTSGWSLAAQSPLTNVARTAVEATAAVLGGTQSLHTNGLDEALALPSEFAARVARETQLVLQHESGLTQSIDSLGGAYALERLTHELAERARAHMAEIEAAGGMTRAIEAGLPQQRIEEAAARRQARIDTGQDVLVGVNRYRADDPTPDLLVIDNDAVRSEQVASLERLRTDRDEGEVERTLAALEQAARSDGNLLAASVDAARARATLGEISERLERVFGRYRAAPQASAGVYGPASGGDERFARARALADEVAGHEGRRPRILVAKLGQDGHDRGAKVIASAFADVGFDVDLGPLFQTPDEVARQAVENDVHFVGISSLAGAHRSLVPQTVRALRDQGRPDIRVVVGGVIPPDDYAALREAGVTAIFGPGTVISEAAIDLLRALLPADAAA